MLSLKKKKTKRIQALETKSRRKLLRISYSEHKTNDWKWSKINFLMGPQELATARDGNLHGSNMSHATTASPKPSFRAPWGVGDAVVGTGNAGWTTSKSGHPCLCRIFFEGFLQKILE